MLRRIGSDAHDGTHVRPKAQVPRHRLHRLPHRLPQGVLLHGGRRGATRVARRPGPRRLHPAAPSAGARPRPRSGTRPSPWSDTEGGLLVLDDSTLDKHYAKKIDLVSRHWSGKHKRVVRGINLITLVWTDGDTVVPCDYRIYDKANDGLTKNDHFLAMLHEAKARGFEPRCVAFDSWYSGLENLKAVRACGWTFLTQLKVNRKVDLDRQGYRAVAEVAIAPGGTVVHLEGFGSIRVFKVVSRDGDVEYWATNDLAMDELTRLAHAERCWAIEKYHRGLKQCCGVERARSGRRGRNATTSGWRSGRSCGWSTISTPPGSAGTRRRPGSSAARCGRTSPTHCTT